MIACAPMSGLLNHSMTLWMFKILSPFKLMKDRTLLTVIVSFIRPFSVSPSARLTCLIFLYSEGQTWEVSFITPTLFMILVSSFSLASLLCFRTLAGLCLNLCWGVWYMIRTQFCLSFLCFFPSLHADIQCPLGDDLFSLHSASWRPVAGLSH